MLKRSEKPGMLKNLRRVVDTATNIGKGYVDSKRIIWCSLDYKTKEGYKDITHPSIGRIGYELLMAASPYPQTLENGGVGYENPYLFEAKENPPFVHFNLVTNQPIALPEEAHYNSDPHIFHKGDTLYLLNRKFSGPDYLALITLQCTRNLKIWSNPLPIIKTNHVCASPFFLNWHGKEYIYLINTHWNELFGHKTIGYQTENIEIWENKRDLQNPDFQLWKTLPWNFDEQIYHGDGFIYEDELYIIFNALSNRFRTFYGIRDHFKYLWIAKSNDLIHFQICHRPLLRRGGIYKPTAYLEDSILHVYFATDNSYYGKDKKAYPSGNRIGYFTIPLKDIQFDQ